MNNLIKSLCLCAFVLIISVNVSVNVAVAQQKREFRGAWIQCVNGQWLGLSTQAMQQNLTRQLDALQQDGCNAVIFQVRPECDALYESDIEPWSRFLTGKQGVAPQPYWDPLQWMITECHRRGMELHAWLNPYRAKSKTTRELSSDHVTIKHPERCFAYDNQLILNPAMQENRDYICRVVDDIVRRYDVDGIHMDDYFYPYPADGQPLPDEEYFRTHTNGNINIGDWRRYNVNIFVKQCEETVHRAKPWVKFGISPFGVYRNKKEAPGVGSNTNAFTNYDGLYADVLLWVNDGIVDYCVPQLYWQIGHPAADYETLIRWWNDHASNRPLFIGEDIERTVKYRDLNDSTKDQLDAKRALHNECRNVNGTVLWYSRTFVDNIGGYADAMRTKYWNHPALQPLMPFIDSKAPGKVKSVKPLWTENGYVLFWTAPKGESWEDKAVKYVVYRFDNGEKVNIDDPSKIVTVTDNTFYKLPYKDGRTKYRYVITALDRLQNESKPVKKKLKL